MSFYGLVAIGPLEYATATAAQIYTGWRARTELHDAGLWIKLLDGSWAQRNPGAGAWWIDKLECSPDYAGVVWAIWRDPPIATGQVPRLLYSSDEGQSWTEVTPTAIAAGVDAGDLAGLHCADQFVYVGVTSAGTDSGIWRADAATPTTWTQVVPQGGVSSGYSTFWVASDRIWFYRASGNNQVIWYRSGGTDTQVPTVIGPSVPRIEGAPDLASRIYVSGGGGGAGAAKVWRIDGTTVTDVTPFSNTFGSTFSIGAAIDQDTVFVSYLDASVGRGKLYKTTNAGSSWGSALIDDVDFGEVGEGAGRVCAVDASDPSLVYATGNNARIWTSDDGGATWTDELITGLSSVDAGIDLAIPNPLRGI